jgi:predicted PurR-regulated permease PerM
VDRQEDDPRPDVLLRDVELDPDRTDPSPGTPGRPVDRRHPSLIGLCVELGVTVACVLFRGVADITSVLVIVGLALFIAVGFNPIITFLGDHLLSRGTVVTVVMLGSRLIVSGFIVVAVPPSAHEFHVLVTNFPHYESEVVAGKDWAGRLTVKLHLNGYRTGK